MANKHMKRYAAALVIRKKQMEAADITIHPSVWLMLKRH